MAGTRSKKAAKASAPPRARKRSAAAVEQAVEHEEPAESVMEEDAPERGATAARTDRRDQMAQIAQRRAAHFATFRTEDDEGADADVQNVHVGGDEACKLGPWSSARQLVAQREAAAEARKERILAGETENQAEDSLDWKPRPNWDSSQRPRKRCIQPLAELCVNTIADYVNCVESLIGLPQVYVHAIARGASNRRKINDEVWQLFTEGSPSELMLPNCTAVNEHNMLKGIKEVCTFRLEVLDLGFCGRGFGDPAAAALAAAGPLPALRRLRLAGAYRLSPSALLKALAATPNLSALEVPNCTCLQGPEVLKIAEALPNLKVVDFSGCRGMETCALLEGLKAMDGLEAVHLDEVSAVTDAVLEALASPRLQVLHVRRCRSITDEGVAAVATVATGSLLDVDLAETLITPAALQALSQCSRMHSLCVRQCKRIKDESALVAIARNGALRSLDVSLLDVATSELLLALAAWCSRSLKTLCLNFCRNVPSQAVGAALDACTELESLSVFGCSQLSAEALRGHRNDNVAVHGEPTFEAAPQRAATADPFSAQALEAAA